MLLTRFIRPHRAPQYLRLGCRAVSTSRTKASFGFSSLSTASAILCATGIGACYVLHPIKVVHLDGEDIPSSKVPALNDLQPARRSALTREKSPEKFANRSADIDGILRQHEESHIVDADSGIVRYDIAQVASNDPTEDDHSEAIIPVPFGTFSLFGVFDGHSGWETSAWLRHNMLIAVISSLADLYGRYGPNERPPPNEIDDDIKDTFKRLDDAIVNESVEKVFRTSSRNAGVNLLAPAYAGSCALLAFYDSESRLLRIALTGDVRAVLGRRRADGTFGVKVLSADQNGANPAEKARLEYAHPGEAVVKGDRVMGMGIARAFGDARYKWGLDVAARLKEAYLGRTPLKDVLTPPYLTAEPEITTTRIEPGDFLVVATDGLWECLSNEEAVGLVGMWLDGRGGGDGVPRGALPVGMDDTDSTVRYRQWGAVKSFVNVDQNAATHLLRNAMGGADTDLTSALLSMRSPRSRAYIDDITATVVFFKGEGVEPE